MDDVAAGKNAGDRVLVAEDHPVNQRVATAMLENLGFLVDVVADGAEAVRAATFRSYQVILMDCQLPILDGYEATREIRRMHGTSDRTPIIAVTATSTDHERCRAAGMDDYITKPLRSNALGALLHRWIAPTSDMFVGSDAVGHDRHAHVPSVQGGALARPALDPQIFERLERLGRDAGEDLIGQLTALFLADADDTVTALGEALAGGDASRMTRSAHALRGASANLGAIDLATICAALAGHGAVGDLTGSGALLEAITVELERVRAALDSRVPPP